MFDFIDIWSAGSHFAWNNLIHFERHRWHFLSSITCQISFADAHVSIACFVSLQMPDKSIHHVEGERDAEKRGRWKHTLTYCPIADLDVVFSFNLFEMTNIFHFTILYVAEYVIKPLKRRKKISCDGAIYFVEMFLRRRCRRLNVRNVVGTGESLLRQQNYFFGTQ